MSLIRRPPTISRVGSSHSTTGGLPITSQRRASTRGRPRPPRKRLAEMVPARVAQEKNTRNAADSAKRHYCRAHRMVTGRLKSRIGLRLLNVGPPFGAVPTFTKWSPSQPRGSSARRRTFCKDMDRRRSVSHDHWADWILTSCAVLAAKAAFSAGVTIWLMS